MLEVIDDLGMRYATPNSKRKVRFYLVKCPECDNNYEAEAQSVKTNRTKRCKSCSSKIINTSHGETNTRLYYAWANMKQRCSNTNSKHYLRYGGRGISVCKEWSSDYLTFKNWAMLNGYADDLTLDRINPDGNYNPSNCRWTTRTVQARNTSIREGYTSVYRGVNFDKTSGKWKAQITVDSKKLSLGYFKCEQAAAIAYNLYVVENKLEHSINIIKG